MIAENIYEEIDDNIWNTKNPNCKPDLPQRVTCNAEKYAKLARDTSKQYSLTEAHASIYQSTKIRKAPPLPELKPPPSNLTTIPKKSRIRLHSHTRFDDDPIESCLETPKHELKKGCRKVLVKGVSASTSKESLELLFENKRKTGGGEIESTVLNEKKGEAIIEFKSIEG